MTHKTKNIIVGGLVIITSLVLGLPVAFKSNQHSQEKTTNTLSQSYQASTTSKQQLLSTQDNYQLLLQKGQYYYSQARIKANKLDLLNQALDAYKQAIALRPEKPQAYFLAGQLYDSIKQGYPQATKQAYQAYLIAHQKDLTESRYLNTLANFLMNNQQPVQAYNILNSDLKYTSANHTGQLILAKASIQIGKLNQAISILIGLKEKQVLPVMVDQQLKVLKKLVEIDPGLKTSLSTAQTTPTDQKTDIIKLEDLPSQQAISRQLVIAAPTEEKAQTNLIDKTNTNALTGKVVLKQNQSEIFVKNNNVKPGSKIVITTQEDINQTIYVKAKQVGGFSLAVSGKLDSDVTVVYWISNE